MSSREFFEPNEDDFDAESEELRAYIENDAISIIYIRCKPKFYQWVMEIHRRMDIPLERDKEEILDYVESFHVPYFSDEEGIRDFFQEFGSDIFYYMFAQYYRDKSFFPTYEGVETFYDWFEIQIKERVKSFEEILDFLDEIDGKVI